MRQLSVVLLVVVVSASAMSAQSSQSASSQSVPRLINVSGVFQPANGQPASAVETVTLSIYADAEGGAPLWQETQTIAIDAQGRYSLLLGATQADGIPAAVFGTGDAKWLGTVFERAGEVEGPRVRITSVPYALRSSDADTLGGRPASAYLLAPGAGGTTDADAAAAEAAGATADVVLPGTPNFLAKYVNGADVGSSGVFEVPVTGGLMDGAVGLGTTTPLDRLHIRYSNNTGDFTGLAVQNMSGGAFAYSGMLFYDHLGALTQFQGYNNSTHEYRINNIAAGGLHQLHARRGVEVHRRQQRQHRHRHHRAGGAPRSQQCCARRAREHVHNQLHERSRSLLHGEESQRHGRRANGRPDR